MVARTWAPRKRICVDETESVCSGRLCFRRALLGVVDLVEVILMGTRPVGAARPRDTLAVFPSEHMKSRRVGREDTCVAVVSDFWRRSISPDLTSIWASVPRWENNEKSFRLSR
jgi:hypothetical protein